jgi:hypothetical protein
VHSVYVLISWIATCNEFVPGFPACNSEVENRKMAISRAMNQVQYDTKGGCSVRQGSMRTTCHPTGHWPTAPPSEGAGTRTKQSRLLTQCSLACSLLTHAICIRKQSEREHISWQWGRLPRGDGCPCQFSCHQPLHTLPSPWANWRCTYQADPVSAPPHTHTHTRKVDTLASPCRNVGRRHVRSAVCGRYLWFSRADQILLHSLNSY